VAWVARTLIVDPLHVFDANIFYPHRWTLAYSESNLGAGALAIPVYWASGNQYAAHNFVLLLSFVLTATCTYYLVRYLFSDRRAGIIAAISFAYCPYVFAHLPHIQLLMTAGLPAGMLALHRMVDVPTPRRGALLGLVMGVQALFCGYYAIFLTLMVGFSVLTVAATGRRWLDVRYWTAFSAAAGVAIAIALPLAFAYVNLHSMTGFSRPLDAARQYSADWRAYFASSSYAHAWLLAIIGRWKEVLFPGFVTTVLSMVGFVVGWRIGKRHRDISILYGGLAALAFWASFGPDAGLYSALYSTFPLFDLLHAPSRFGVVVALALSVVAAGAISWLLGRVARPVVATIVLTVVVTAELIVPVSFPDVPADEAAYRVLADLPRGALIEVPVYSTRFAVARTRYILGSTIHWMPLVNAYSDYMPQDFIDETPTLGSFPSRESFMLLARDGVRYAVVHLDLLGREARDDLVKRLREFDAHLSRRYADERIWLYEIVSYPEQS
jgi:hypothetical protein